MPESQRCPKCGLINPSEARRCDCGWNFSAAHFDTSGPPNVRAGSQSRRTFAYFAGVVGFSIMAIRGLMSTLDPKPDGRLLNTAPAIGVDVFLFVGLIGIGFCIVQLIRNR